MRTITILLLTIFCLSFSGCGTVERRIVCKQIDSHQIPDVEYCDISFSKNRCRCRMFDMNEWEPVGDPVNHPIEYCERIAGPRLDDIATNVRPQVKALAQLKRNMCN